MVQDCYRERVVLVGEAVLLRDPHELLQDRNVAEKRYSFLKETKKVLS